MSQKRNTNGVLAKSKRSIIDTTGDKIDAHITDLKKSHVVVRETEKGTTIIIDDKLMMVFDSAPSFVAMEKTPEGFKLKDKSTTTHYKQEKPGCYYIHKEDGPAVIAEDYDDYRWYYQGKWIKGLRKKEASPEEYSMYVFEQFMKEKP